jgi:hypothetical protein
MESSEDIYYCNEYRPRGVEEDCIACPSGAVCDQGQIIGCFEDYTFVNNQKCILKSKFEEIHIEMSHFIEDLAASLNGINQCYEEGIFNF